MKRIEVVLKIEKLRPVVNALKKMGVGGITVTQVRGRGSSAVPVVSGLRGTARFVADFNSRNLIYTIVDDSKVEQVISTILVAAKGKAQRGMGKIFVTTVDDAIDLGSGRRGQAAL